MNGYRNITVLYTFIYHFLVITAKFELFSVFRRGTPKLGMAKVTQVDFPPRETVSYTKETQTPTMTQTKEGDFNVAQVNLEL